MTLQEAIEELRTVRNLMGPSKVQRALDVALPALEYYAELKEVSEWNAQRRKEALENDKRAEEEK